MNTDLPGPAPVLGFLLVHAALRREVRDLAACVERCATSGRADDESSIDRRLALFDRVLRAHHHGEDRVLLPLLRSREPLISDVADQVEEQHARLDETLDAMRIHIEKDNAAGLTVRSRLLATTLEDHLVLEETRLLPVWVASLTPAEHAEFSRRLRRATPWRDISVMIPWLIDAVPDQYRPLAESELPSHVRFAYRHGMRRRFERRYRDRAGTHTPLNVGALAPSFS